MNNDVRDAFECLKKYRKYLTRQQTRTIAGQIKSGDINGAMNGLSNLLDRKGI